MGYEWLLDKLESGDKDAEIDLPSGGDFVRGYAGNWTQRVMYRLYAPIEIDLSEFEPDARVPTRSQTGAWWYWYQRPGQQEKSVEAAKFIDQRNSNRVWRWEMPTSTMLNFSGDEDVTDKFGESISADIDIVGLQSQKRTELQLLFLPSLVQAIALAADMIKEPVFNYEGLLWQAEDVTPEYCERMVGPLGSNGQPQWEEGELWTARTALWAALGEDNPKLWTAPIRRRVNGNGKSETVNANPLTDVTSERLAVCLGLINAPGTSYWARIVRVAAPRMPTDKERDNDRLPFGMNIVGSIWQDKESAIADLGLEDQTSYPEMPEAWAGTSPADFRDWLKTWMQEQDYVGKPLPIITKELKKRKDLESLAVTADELLPWIEQMNNGK